MKAPSQSFRNIREKIRINLKLNSGNYSNYRKATVAKIE